jgi:signal transduction histidine kinase
VNRAFADFGSRDPAELLGRTVREVVGSAYYEQLAPQIAGALDGAAARFEMAVNSENGPRRLEVNYIPHRGAAGQVDGFFSIAADITEQHAFDEQRRQGETLEAMAQFSAGLARDFEDALSAITDAATALRRAPRSPAERARAIGEIERAAEGAAALVAQLRRFGGLQVVQPVVVPVNEIVRQADPALRAALGTGTTLETQLGADAGDVYIDPAHAAQALASLGTFAAAAMPNAQTVRLRTRAAALEPGGASRHPGLGVGAYTVLSLTDHGAGIVDDARTRAFTPALSSRADGPSPELASVYGLVRQLGGQVYVDSSPGAGTTIEVWFPRVPGAPSAELHRFPDAGAVRSS